MQQVWRFYRYADRTLRERDLNAALNLEHAPKDRVRAASAEFTPADKKEPTPKVEAGSKRQIKRNT